MLCGCKDCCLLSGTDVGLGKQTGATRLLPPKRLLVVALVGLVGAVGLVLLAGLLTGAALMVNSLLLIERMFVTGHVFARTSSLIKVHTYFVLFQELHRDVVDMGVTFRLRIIALLFTRVGLTPPPLSERRKELLVLGVSQKHFNSGPVSPFEVLVLPGVEEPFINGENTFHFKLVVH